MKRFVAVIMLLSLIFALCACSETTPQENASEINTQNEHTELLSDGRVSGQIFAVFGNEQDSSTEFICNEKITPARIAAGLTGWTGLKFRIKATTDDANKTITVDWLEDSSLATGTIPEALREPFSFEDSQAMRLFMLASLSKSIKENLGDFDIYFTVQGEDIAKLKLKGVSSDTPFDNK